MRWLRFIGGLVLCCLVMRPLWADQQEQLPNVLTWQDCVGLAVRKNPVLLAALATMESSHAQYKQSYNGILPQLSLSNSYTDSSSSHVGIGTNGVSTILSNNSQVWTLGGTASIDLVDFGQWASIQNALGAYHQVQASVAVAANNALLNLYQAFAALLYAQEEVKVDLDILGTWKTNADMVALRYDSGTESKGDNMNTQAQLLQAQASVSQSSRDVLVAQQELSTAVGLNDFSALVVTGTWSAPPAPDPHPDFDALLERVPSVKVQEAVVEQSKAAIKSARSTLFPTLGFSYSRGRSGDYEFPTDPFWTFTGTARYPLFANGLTYTYYAMQSAQHSYDSARQTLSATRTQALNTLVSAWSGYAKAQDQVNVQRALLDAAWQQEKEYTVLYQGGLETYQQWILIVQNYVNDQISYLQAQQNLVDAEAQWRFATGEKLGD